MNLGKRLLALGFVLSEPIEGHTEDLCTVAVMADGRRAVSGSED
jgi:hypothetical protein